MNILNNSLISPLLETNIQSEISWNNLMEEYSDLLYLNEEDETNNAPKNVDAKKGNKFVNFIKDFGKWLLGVINSLKEAIKKIINNIKAKFINIDKFLENIDESKLTGKKVKYTRSPNWDQGINGITDVVNRGIALTNAIDEASKKVQEGGDKNDFFDLLGKTMVGKKLKMKNMFLDPQKVLTKVYDAKWCYDQLKKSGKEIDRVTKKHGDVHVKFLSGKYSELKQNKLPKYMVKTVKKADSSMNKVLTQTLNAAYKMVGINIYVIKSVLKGNNSDNKNNESEEN